jgi:uncharacterized membrane protein
MALELTVHVLAAVIWVGGMFFAYVALRPASNGLETSARLELWRKTLATFFPWIWLSAAVLLISGFYMLFKLYLSFAGAPMHVHLMLGLGILMMLLFAHVFFAPYRRLGRALAEGELEDAARRLRQIRLMLAINLVFGFIVIIAATGGAYF